jgi:hypothetical protein
MTGEINPEREREFALKSREKILDAWLSSVLKSLDYERLPLAGDASFTWSWMRLLQKLQSNLWMSP